MKNETAGIPALREFFFEIDAGGLLELSGVPGRGAPFFQTFADCFCAIRESGAVFAEDRPLLLAHLAAALQAPVRDSFVFRARLGGGGFHRCRAYYSSLARCGAVERVVGCICDDEWEKRLEQLADSDPLTGLLNRRAFRQRVERMLMALDGSGSSAMAVIDMDGFKEINDRFGHPAGDAALIAFGGLLSAVASARFGAEVCRLGGDEFAFFLWGSGEEGVQRIADELVRRCPEAVRRPDGRGVRCSLGAAFAGQGAQDYITLYRMADFALYRSKFTGKGCCTFYER